jgi:hypothetical protein
MICTLTCLRLCLSGCSTCHLQQPLLLLLVMRGVRCLLLQLCGAQQACLASMHCLAHLTTHWMTRQRRKRLDQTCGQEMELLLLLLLLLLLVVVVLGVLCTACTTCQKRIVCWMGCGQICRLRTVLRRRQRTGRRQQQQQQLVWVAAAWGSGLRLLLRM